MRWQHHRHDSVGRPHCFGFVESRPQGSQQMPKACWNWGSHPDDPWIAFGTISPSCWRITQVHSHTDPSSHPAKSVKSNNLSSFCTISSSFRSKWQCFCSYNPTHLLSNGCSATPYALPRSFLVFCNADRLRIFKSSNSVFFFFFSWIIYLLFFYCLTFYTGSFFLTIPSSIPLSPFAVKRNQAAPWTLCLEISSANI